MIYDKKLQGKQIYLKNLGLEYCQQYYVDWLNDTSINSYIEPRLYHQTLEGVTKYVKDLHESSDGYIFGIFCEDKHIGNIQLSAIHPIYKCAKIGYVIGDKNYWGRGIATEAISLIKHFGFDILNLHRLEALVFEEHIASQKALGKNGFVKEATFIDKVKDIQNNRWCNYCVFGVINPNYQEI